MSDSRFAGIALDTVVLVALATALLLTAGWGYAQQWLGYFDLGPVELALPLGAFARYGYRTLGAYVWWILPGAGLVGVLPLVRCWLRERLGLPIRVAPRFCIDSRSAYRTAARVLLLGLILGLFWGGYSLGQQTAARRFARDQGNGFCGFPAARVMLKTGSSLSTALSDLTTALAAGRYRLLARCDALLALVRTDTPPPAGQSRWPSLVVPVGEVALLELLPVPAGCEEEPLPP